MPKSEPLKRIDQHAPGNAVIVGGTYLSRQALAVSGLQDPSGATAAPDAAGRVRVVGRDGIRVDAQSAQLVLSVDGTIPRLGFTGKQVVGRGTTLLYDLPADGAFLTATEDTFAPGDVLLVQARGQQEYIGIGSVATSDGDGYAYNITRNLDGSGAGAWHAGDVALRLGGSASDHFLELSGAADLSGATSGPRLAVQQMTGPHPGDWQPVALLGNLAGHFGFAPEAPFGSSAHWGAGFGLYGIEGEPWALIEAGAGVQLGLGGYLGLHLTPGGDIDQYAGAQHRSHLGADGSGWFVAPDKISWDAAGNLTIDAALKTRSLQVGPSHGPTILGNVVIDRDADGQPLPDARQSGHFGLWVEDRFGRRRIALLTGTQDWPDRPALMVGAPDDASYLKFEGDRLEIQGEIHATAGEVGRFSILASRLESLNERVRLIAEADDDFGEGLALMTGPSLGEAGSVRWNDPTPPPSRPDYTLGIKMCYFDAAYGGWIMQSQTTTPYGDDTSPTKHVWISGQWNGARGIMALNHFGTLTVPTVAAQAITGSDYGLNLSRIFWTRRLAGLTINSNLGGVARIAEHQGGFTGAPATQLPVNAAEVTIPIPLDLPAGVGTAYIHSLTIRWRKTNANAYFAYVKIIRSATADNTVAQEVIYPNVGQGSATGLYTQTVIGPATTPYPLALDRDRYNYYLILKTAGVASANDLQLHHIEIGYVDYDLAA